MSEGPGTHHRRRRASGITGAVILITIGVLFLLKNLGYVHFSWLDLLRFWPVILILIGLDLVVGRRGVFGSLIMTVLALVIIGGIIWAVSTERVTFGTGNTVAGTFNQELGDADALEVTLRLGALDTTVGATAESQYAAQGNYTSDPEYQLSTRYEVRDGTGHLTLSQNTPPTVTFPFDSTDYTASLDLQINETVPLDLILEANAGRVTLDLRDLNLRSVTVKAGVGDLDLKLPDQGQIDITIEAALGTLTISLPDNMEAYVDIGAALGGLDLPTRFEKLSTNQWQTPGYSDSAPDRVWVRIQSGMGSVTIN